MLAKICHEDKTFWLGNLAASWGQEIILVPTYISLYTTFMMWHNVRPTSFLTNSPFFKPKEHWPVIYQETRGL